MRRILALARAEVLHVVRDRATLAQVLLIPFVQLLVLASAATFQIRDTATYVVDQDRTSASRGLVSRLAGSGHFRITGASASPALANRQLLAGDVTMVLTIPTGFERDLVPRAVPRIHAMIETRRRVRIVEVARGRRDIHDIAR